MRNWLIYEPPGGACATLEDSEKFVILREGFSKPAFVLAPFWLAWRRCWLALALWAAAIVGVVVLVSLTGLRGGPAALALALPSLAVGLESAWLRARALERRGYALAGSAVARSREEAEALFFVDWLADRSDASARSSGSGASAPYQPSGSGVLGLFPAPGAAR